MLSLLCIDSLYVYELFKEMKKLFFHFFPFYQKNISSLKSYTLYKYLLFLQKKNLINKNIHENLSTMKIATVRSTLTFGMFSIDLEQNKTIKKHDKYPTELSM